MEEISFTHKPATFKQRIAALRMLLDHLVVTGVLCLNPARRVAAPKEQVRKGKTPALHGEELDHEIPRPLGSFPEPTRLSVGREAKLTVRKAVAAIFLALAALKALR